MPKRLDPLDVAVAALDRITKVVPSTDQCGTNDEAQRIAAEALTTIEKLKTSAVAGAGARQRSEPRASW